MSLEEFRQAFPAENDLVERKTGAGRKPLYESIVAMSNTDGGVILIGVDNDGNVLGRKLDQGLADDLHEAVKSVRDPGRYSIHELRVDNATPITVLSIAKRIEGFAQTASGRVLVRRGSLDVPLFGPELRDFLNERSLERFETTELPTSLSEVPKSSIGSVADAFGWSDSRTFAERLAEVGLARQSGYQYHLTVAGALHLLPRPHEQLGKAYIEILRYREGSATYDRRTQIEGPLREQVEQATRQIGDELGTEIVILGVHRHELPRLPQRVLREAIANAVAHRSYELKGTPVRIEIRSDAVTITSPGSLPEPVTVENMRDQAAARNANVIRALRAYNLAEDSGAGIDVMEDVMREELLDPPSFSDNGSEVQVTLPIRSAVAPSERAWVREVEQEGLIEPSDRILLVSAARGITLTNSIARRLLGADAERARSSLQRLRDAGFLVQRGQRGGSSYLLDRSLTPPAAHRLGHAELEEMVIGLATKRPLANADVRAATGLDRDEALDLLRRLVAQGRLVRRGDRRGTRYQANI